MSSILTFSGTLLTHPASEWCSHNFPSTFPSQLPVLPEMALKKKDVYRNKRHVHKNE